MRRIDLPRLVFSILACVSPTCISCSGGTPGTELGTYSVVATSTTNTCGSGLGAPNPWEFSVRLSKDGSTLYWSWLNNTSPISGSLDSTSSTTITSSQSSNVDGTDAGAGPCTMERDDSLSVTLGSGTTPTTFTGTISYAFAATSGSVCADQLTTSGGSYATLPCTIAYSLSATKQ